MLQMISYVWPSGSWRPIWRPHGEHRERRENLRNGYRERDWHTRSGTIALRIPKLRKGRCFPSVLELRKSSEKALAAVIREAYVQGISTRSVDDLVKALAYANKRQRGRWCLR